MVMVTVLFKLFCVVAEKCSESEKSCGPKHDRQCPHFQARPDCSLQLLQGIPFEVQLLKTGSGIFYTQENLWLSVSVMPAVTFSAGYVLIGTNNME